MFFQSFTNLPAGAHNGSRFEIPVIRTGTPMRRRPLRTALALLAGGLLGAGSSTEQPLAAGQGVEAVERLAETFAADPESAEARRSLWRLARGAAPRPDLAEAMVAAADRLGPDGWVAAGVLLRRALRPLDAIEAFDRASTRSPESPMPDIEAGRLLAELRSHELALTRFGRHPEDPAAMHGKAVILARMKRTDEALALTDTLLRENPGNPAATLLRAELLDSMGRGSETVNSLRQLVEETNPSGPAAFRLARILVQREQFREAVPILGEVLAEAPGNAEAWLALARAHRSAGRRTEAAEAFRRALREDPTLNEARFGLARLLARDGEHEEAERLFAEFERRKAVADESGRLLGEAELRPDDFRPVAAFVNHALANRDFGLALRGAQRFLIEFPDDPERHLLLARVFREGGSVPEALRVLRRGRDRFAGNSAARRRFEAALAAVGARS